MRKVAQQGSRAFFEHLLKALQWGQKGCWVAVTNWEGNPSSVFLKEITKVQIKQATVRAGRTVPHPTRSYSNVKTEIELVADIDDGEAATEAINKLRIQAEQIVQTHQEQVCESIRKGTEIASTQSRIETLEAELKMLKEKQKSHQGLLFASTEVNVNEYDDEWEER